MYTHTHTFFFKLIESLHCLLSLVIIYFYNYTLNLSFDCQIRGVYHVKTAGEFTIDIYNKHCWKILQEIILKIVSNDLILFMVGQSHNSFTLLSVKDVLLFGHRAVHVHGVQNEGTLRQT
jgi:hypothetical protein